MAEESEVFEFVFQDVNQGIGDDVSQNEDNKSSVQYEEPEKETIVSELPSEKEDPGESNEDVKKYDLNDYLDFEKRLTNNGTPDEPKDIKEKTDDVELNFEVKRGKDLPPPEAPPIKGKKMVEPPYDWPGEMENPFERPIEEAKKLLAEERRDRLSSFNHSFKSHVRQVSDVQNIPAYKRQGVDIDTESKASDKTQVGNLTVSDEDGKGNLRSNNRFLHDNVD
jgi:cell division protein FtsZ